MKITDEMVDAIKPVLFSGRVVDTFLMRDLIAAVAPMIHADLVAENVLLRAVLSQVDEFWRAKCDDRTAIGCIGDVLKAYQATISRSQGPTRPEWEPAAALPRP